MDKLQKGVAKVNPKIYNEEDKLVGLDALKKHDLLIVYWKTPQEESLIEFDHLSLDKEGFLGHIFYHYLELLYFWWGCIDYVKVSGNDPSERTMWFVYKLYKQKEKEENAAQKMRDNIDALKA